MARNPDPTVALTTSKGTTRTLDDWATMFHLCLVILPDRPEAAAWIPVARRIFAVLGDADCRTAFVVTGTPLIAKRILGEDENEVLTFVDPEQDLVKALGLERLPAFVHLRQDTSLADAAEGWDPEAWQRVAKGVASSMHWSVPDVAAGPAPAPTPGWAVGG